MSDTREGYVRDLLAETQRELAKERQLAFDAEEQVRRLRTALEAICRAKGVKEARALAEAAIA